MRSSEDEKKILTSQPLNLSASITPNPKLITPNCYRDIALLAIAVFLLVIYLLKEFYLSKGFAPLPSASSVEQTVFEVEYPAGVSKTYTSPKNVSLKDAMNEAGIDKYKHTDEIIKRGSKIVISKEGSVDIGLMSGEKHLIFSIPLDINKAAAQDFEALPGIGPKLAERIIETRERIGGFKTVDDLKKVKGIGDKKMDKIKDFIAYREADGS